jgi:proline iminopeptidase
MTPEKDYVTTDDGVRLFVQKLGSGSNVVIIPNHAYMFEDFKHLANQHTVISYDLRNRGHSDIVSDASKLKGGVHNDVRDLEAIRSHFNVDSVALIGHSYVGMVVVLYAMQYPPHVNRVVQIGAVPPDINTQYPRHLTGADATLTEISAKIAALQKEGPSGDAGDFGKKIWSLMRQLYVVNPADADKITWSVGDLPNESILNVMKYYGEYLLPSIQNLSLGANDFRKMQAPVLVIHGTRDRQAPYGGARDWALRLPNSRLVTIDDAAHLPWIEAPETVFASVGIFLNGVWPDAAKGVEPGEARLP